jgi:hypothetical protein
VTPGALNSQTIFIQRFAAPHCSASEIDVESNFHGDSAPGYFVQRRQPFADIRQRVASISERGTPVGME